MSRWRERGSWLALVHVRSFHPQPGADIHTLVLALEPALAYPAVARVALDPDIQADTSRSADLLQMTHAGHVFPYLPLAHLPASADAASPWVYYACLATWAESRTRTRTQAQSLAEQRARATYVTADAAAWACEAYVAREVGRAGHTRIPFVHALTLGQAYRIAHKGIQAGTWAGPRRDKAIAEVCIADSAEH